MRTWRKYLVALGALFFAVALAVVWNALVPSGERMYLPASTRAPGESVVLTEDGARIDLNSADEEMLLSLPTLSTEKARAIVKWREAHGPFASVEQAVELFAGRSKKTAEEMRARLIVR